jgi:hypothetical protein
MAFDHGDAALQQVPHAGLQLCGHGTQWVTIAEVGRTSPTDKRNRRFAHQVQHFGRASSALVECSPEADAASSRSTTQARMPVELRATPPHTRPGRGATRSKVTIAAYITSGARSAA